MVTRVPQQADAFMRGYFRDFLTETSSLLEPFGGDKPYGAAE